MRELKKRGPYVDVVQAPIPLPGNETLIEFGVKPETFKSLEQRVLFSSIGQYYGLVQDGMQQARHVFSGLKRPLAVADDMCADQKVLVYSWKPKVDYEWEGTPSDGKPVQRTPGNEMVFVVLVRSQPQLAGQYQVWGDIVKWNWVKEDQQLAEAPLDWEHRYAKQLRS